MIGQAGGVLDAPGGKGGSVVEPEQRPGVVDIGRLARPPIRHGLDVDRNIAHITTQGLRYVVERFPDQLGEFVG
jgi:hypothetical protein